MKKTKKQLTYEALEKAICSREPVSTSAALQGLVKEALEMIQKDPDLADLTLLKMSREVHPGTQFYPIFLLGVAAFGSVLEEKKLLQ